MLSLLLFFLCRAADRQVQDLVDLLYRRMLRVVTLFDAEPAGSLHHLYEASEVARLSEASSLIHCDDLNCYCVYINCRHSNHYSFY